MGNNLRYPVKSAELSRTCSFSPQQMVISISPRPAFQKQEKSLKRRPCLCTRELTNGRLVHSLSTPVFNRSQQMDPISPLINSLRGQTVQARYLTSLTFGCLP